MKKSHRLLSLLLSLPVFLVSCGKGNVEDTKTIYTTFYQIYDITKAIVGEKYEVKCLTPYGQEPHDYEPTAKEIAEMTSASSIFLNGLGLDQWSDSLPESIKKKCYTLTKGIETKRINGIEDPHVWLSVKNTMKELLTIKDIVTDLDSENQEYYEDNYSRELNRLKELDEKYQSQLNDIKNKYLVVSHAAFGYLANDYGLTQIYIAGLEPDATPTAKKMEELIEKVKKYHVSTIFYEETISPDIAKKIAEEANVKTETLHTLESIEKEDEGKVDYISLMEDNLSKITKAGNA